MPNRNHSGTDKLRHGRTSIANARYFITLCTDNRRSGLHQNGLRQKLIAGLREQQINQDFDLHCATIMPDHMHLLFTLGARLSLPQTVGKYKRWMSNLLQDRKLGWQSNFYDHRLRQDKSLETFARYIFLNPYRKHYIDPTEAWTGWICHKQYRPLFAEHLIEGKYPPQEWLARDTYSLQQLIEGDQQTETSELE